MATFKHKTFILYSVGVFIILVIAGCLIEPVLPKGYVIITIALGFAILFFTLRVVDRNALDKIVKKSNDQSAIGDGWRLFYAAYPMQLKMPLITSFTIAPDFAFVLANAIQTGKPKAILELGSGRTTLIAAACLKQFGIQGKIISVDADKTYLDQCRYYASLNNLDAYIHFVYAPLVSQQVNEQSYVWYDPEVLPAEKCDLLIIDGPPEKAGTLSRYPALPRLSRMLSETAIVLADDAGRPDMQATALRWQREYPAYRQQYIHTLRGTLQINVAS